MENCKVMPLQNIESFSKINKAALNNVHTNLDMTENSYFPI